MDPGDVAIPIDLFNRLDPSRGRDDKEAQAELRKILDGLETYDHVLVMPGKLEDWAFVDTGWINRVIDRPFYLTVTYGFMRDGTP